MAPQLREATMTGSALSTASRYPLLAAAPALARFHPEAGVDARRGPQSSDTDQLLFRKRSNPAVLAPPEIAFGPFRLRPAQFLLLEGDKPVRLGSRALEILVVLLERPGELVSKQELMGRVWPNIFVAPANLTVHMSALRRTLRDGRDGNRFIINVPGRGYSFVTPVEVRREAHIGADKARRCGAGPSSGGWLHAHRIDWDDQVRWSDPQTRQSHS
jgi:DNA-binding winged helix-turn-helix (wHTH) protein